MAIRKTGGAHHVRLTVSDFEHSLKFYTEVLGFDVRLRFGDTSVLLHDGTMGLGLSTPRQHPARVPLHALVDDGR